MADKERDDEASEDHSDYDESEGSEEGTKPGDWESQPADKEDLRHDDSAEPLAEPLGDDADDDLAEQESGDVATGDDEGFDRPDTPEEKQVGDTGRRLEEEAEPLFGGPELNTPFGPLPTRSVIGIAAFIVVFCVVFFGMWALLGGIGILLGIILGTAAGFGAMKFLALNAA